MTKLTMRIFRTILSALLALCIAVAPLASVVATPANALQSAEHAIGHDRMPDCHGMKAKQSTPAQQQKEHCPHCKDSVCTSDVCKLKCFKVIGDLPRGLKSLPSTPARVGISASRDFLFVQIRPPLPPPRT